MVRLAVIAVVVCGGLLLGAASAEAGGSAVAAPSPLDDAACAAGSQPDVGGPLDPALFVVLGCARLERSGVLIAAESEGRTDRRRGFACYYTAPEGSDDTGRCYDVRPPGATPDPHRFPVTGASGLAQQAVGDLGGGAGFAVVQASAGVDSVSFRFRAGDGARMRADGEQVPVDEEQAAKLGAPDRFAFHVATIPSNADTCRGIVAVGHDLGGERIDTVGFDRHARTHRTYSSGGPSSVALPGSRRCRTRTISADLDRLTSLARALVDSTVERLRRLVVATGHLPAEATGAPERSYSALRAADPPARRSGAVHER